MSKSNDRITVRRWNYSTPAAILEIPGLSIYEQMIYMVLQRYANNETSSAFPSYNTLATKGRMSRRKAIDAVATLIEKGLITKEVRYADEAETERTSNVYIVEDAYDVLQKMIANQQQTDEIHTPSAQHAPPLVHSMHHPSAQHAPEHKYLTEPLINMSVCMNAREEHTYASEESVSNEIYESIQKHVPKNCYIANGMTMSGNYINEIYLMLVNQFPIQLDAKVIEIACNLYRDRVSDLFGNMIIKINNPVGFFNECYKDAIKQYKVQSKKGNG